MPNDGSFQIFTARFRERNPSSAVNAITFGRAIYTAGCPSHARRKPPLDDEREKREEKGKREKKRHHRSGWFHESAQITRSVNQLECAARAISTAI